MIIVQPIGGLCNRLRSIDSAVELAEKTGKRVHVIWVCNSEINCKFSDLFDIPEQINTLTEIKIGLRILRVSLEQLADIYFSNFNNCDLKYLADLSENTGLFDRISAADKVYIRTSQPFYPPAAPFKRFVPSRGLQKEIDFYRGENMVGVHMRRTDNVKSTMHGPLQKFIERMHEEIDKDQRVRFFVATDDPQEENNLRRIFKDKIITHKKRSLDRNDPLAIQDAVIDLYCLANCRALIGSYWSSFTDAAWQINQIDKIIIGP